MATTEKELTLKATAADAPRLDAPRLDAPKAAPRVVSVTAQSLGVEPQVEVPAGAEEWRQSAERALMEKVEAYASRMDARHRSGEDKAALGEPTVGTYVALDVLAYSPIQQITFPPYEPSRIIAAGEDAIIWALVFINPTVDVAQGFAIPATVQLGGRQMRVRLEQVNLSDLTNGPDQTFAFTLPAPAPSLIWLPFQFTATDPGVNPDLFEANVTVDIVDPVQPYAAFATHHVSVDADPGFLDIPPQPGWQLLHNIPMRYLVYRR
jgi:hypothetical protein